MATTSFDKKIVIHNNKVADTLIKELANPELMAKKSSVDVSATL